MLIVEWFLWLVAYSFIGWVYESTLCSITGKRLVNRGFLNGPLCPVYGFGALVTLLFLDQRVDNIVLLFIAGMLLTCTVEYITAVLLEKLFHAKWWDYSYMRFNFQGRVSLLGAIVFGLLAVLLIKVVHPFVGGLISELPSAVQIGLSMILFVIIMIDLYITVRHIWELNGRLREIQLAINGYLGQYAKRAEELKKSLMDNFEESKFYSEHIKTLFHQNRVQNRRILRAFPKLRSMKYDDAWQKLKDTLLRANDKD